ncbi:GroES-like protein [Calocera viscosa TUFC12733]|uniref:GroES-like protein n=1 Tax=Calocera viscosa (strain TUFC12733) TaxID=1330018 RepID=A0A167P6V5_CALVF|nr:GroES-like protein [Calocera viscosa TUFC12733]
MSLPSSMQAITFPHPGPPSVLTAQTLPLPALEGPYDILVRLRACSLNPVDTKARSGAFPCPSVLGFDGAGVVVSSSPQALFKPGEGVMYSGVLGRSGTNAQYSVVDSRIAGLVPDGWEWTDAAALPLVGITAWEMLEGKFGLKPWPEREVEETLVVVNGAGGVGSVATQLARNVFKLKNVVVTASRKETVEWAEANGATLVINHREDIAEQLTAHSHSPSYAFICHSTAYYLPPLCRVMSPWGHIGSIVEDPSVPLPFSSMDAFDRALTFSWEFMFSRPMRGWKVEEQGEILGKLKRAAERGEVRSGVRVRKVLGARALREAHEMVEAGKGVGKIVFDIGESIGE